MTAILNKTARPSTDPLTTMAAHLAAALAILGQPSARTTLDLALHALLEGKDEQSKQLRTAMQIHLVKVSNDQLGGSAKGSQSPDMLSTEAAAGLMGCSRPYVAMLIDAQRLEGGVVSKGGHRKVPRASVLRWMDANRAGKDSDYKSAAADVGMYTVPEAEYVKTEPRKRQRAD